MGGPAQAAQTWRLRAGCPLRTDELRATARGTMNVDTDPHRQITKASLGHMPRQSAGTAGMKSGRPEVFSDTKQNPESTGPPARVTARKYPHGPLAPRRPAALREPLS